MAEWDDRVVEDSELEAPHEGFATQTRVGQYPGAQSNKPLLLTGVERGGALGDVRGL